MIAYFNRKNKMALIYKITNKIDGKQYIGATIYKLNERWNRHTSDTLLKKDNQYLHSAMRKHGIENFTIEILEEHPDANYTFNTLESKYIKEYKTHSTENGYNMTWGGDGWLGMKHSEKTKEKLRKLKTGRKASPETRAKLSALKKGIPSKRKGIPSEAISKAKRGKKRSLEFIEKCRLAKIGMKQSESQKNKIRNKISENHKVKLPSGEIIDIFNLRQFCKDNQLSQGNLKTYGHSKGFKMIETIKNIKTYRIQNVYTQEIIETTNLKQTCKTLNIDNSRLYGTYNQAYQKDYNGWRLLEIITTNKVVKFNAPQT